jgi:hypothetical protein
VIGVTVIASSKASVCGGGDPLTEDEEDGMFLLHHLLFWMDVTRLAIAGNA